VYPEIETITKHDTQQKTRNPIQEKTLDSSSMANVPNIPTNTAPSNTRFSKLTQQKTKNPIQEETIDPFSMVNVTSITNTAPSNTRFSKS